MSTRYVAAGAAAAAVAAVIILASSRGDVDRMVKGDGLIYRYVAAHFSQEPDAVDPVVQERGTSLRYGRAGFPALIWLFSGGRPPAMPYVQPALIVAAAAAAGVAAVRLAPRTGPLAPLIPFLAPGFALAVSGGFAEVVAVAIGLWAVVLAREGRWWPAAAMLAAAMLVRENAGAVLIGLAVWCALRRKVSPIGILALSVVPLTAWYAFVAVRYGHIPILDPYLRVTTDTIGPPVVTIYRAIVDAPATSSSVTAAIHLALAVVGFALWRRSIAGAIAAASGLQVLAAGRFSFMFEGEAVRQFVFLQLFVVLALLWSRWSEQPAGEPATARAEVA